VVALKGAGTVVATNNCWAINTTGTPAQANAGQGDVLTGIIAALMAQGLSPWQAACLGVYAHGLAAQQVAAKRRSKVVLASEVSEQMDVVLAGLVDSTGQHLCA
jgi:ADP-dependent NAD(P)H-hydrate dehydratase / NAD(P)H-hydrate epimerase